MVTIYTAISVRHVRRNGVDCRIFQNCRIEDLFGIVASNLGVELRPNPTMLFVAKQSEEDDFVCGVDRC